MYPIIDWTYLHKVASSRDTLKQLEKLQRTVKRFEKVYRQMWDETSSSLDKDKTKMRLF